MSIQSPRAATGVNPVTSNGLSFADPTAGIRQLFVLAPDC
jgi:hypothetical protein